VSETVRWKWFTFEELPGRELYDVLALRQHVFVVEQQCVFTDIDGRDQQAWHLLGRTSEGILAAYLRAFPPRPPAGAPTIGRVAVDPSYRGAGLGRSLMEEGMRMIRGRYPQMPIRIAAQLLVEPFYARMGFARKGEPYNEDGILHVDMIRESS
jgi:ElaA protein